MSKAEDTKDGFKTAVATSGLLTEAEKISNNDASLKTRSNEFTPGHEDIKTKRKKEEKNIKDAESDLSSKKRTPN